MFIEQVPPLFRKLYPKAIWRMNPEEKAVYLTFDDGPIPEVTPWVLGHLERYNIKATFFMVGDNVHKFPDEYRMVVEGGHRIGNHTFNHLQGLFTSTKRYIDNVDRADAFLHSNLFRPPHGIIRSHQYYELSKRYKICNVGPCYTRLQFPTIRRRCTCKHKTVRKKRFHNNIPRLTAFLFKPQICPSTLHRVVAGTGIQFQSL